MPRDDERAFDAELLHGQDIFPLFLICLAVTFMHRPLLATESVYCANEEIGLFVYYNIGHRSYTGQTHLHIDNQMVVFGETEDIKTDFKKKTISLKTRRSSEKNATLQLQVKRKRGTLKYGGKTYKVSCDWAAFE